MITENETKDTIKITKLKNCFPTKKKENFVKLYNQTLLKLVLAVKNESPNSSSFNGPNVFLF